MCRRLVELRQAMAGYGKGFDPARLTGADAARVVKEAAAIENMAATIKGLAAARVADTGVWRKEGDRSAAHHLARTTGTSVGHATDAIDTARKMDQLPEVAAKARGGELSSAQSSAIASAAHANPSAEGQLLDRAEKASLAELRDECARVKAAAEPDPEARRHRIHKERYLRSYTDTEGAWHLRVRNNPEAGAQFMAALAPITDALFHAARLQGRREPVEAYAADALNEMADLATWAGEAPSEHRDAAAGDGTAGEATSDSSEGMAGEHSDGTAGDASGEHTAGPSQYCDRPSERGGAAAGDGTAGDASGEHTAGPSQYRDRPSERGDGSADYGAPPGENIDGTAGDASAAGDRTPGEDTGAAGVGTAGDPFGATDHDASPSATTNGSRTRPTIENWLARRPGRVRRWAPAKLIARIDLTAMLRGAAVAGEVCELVGFGPVAVSVIRDMIDSGDPFLAAIATKGRDIVGVAHLGRRATAHQQTALEWLYPACAAEGCPAQAYLEIDHREDWAKTHITLFDLLDRLCSRHHALKTHDGWALVDGTGKRAFVPPDDPRHPRQRAGPSPSSGFASTAPAGARC